MDWQPHRLAVLGRAHEDLTIADPVAFQHGNITEAQRRVAEQQRHCSGACPLIATFSDYVTRRDDSADLVRLVWRSVRRLQVSRHRNLQRNISPDPLVIGAEAKEVAEDLQFLRPRQGRYLSSTTEAVQRFKVALVKGSNTAPIQKRFKETQHLPTLPFRLRLKVRVRFVVGGDRAPNFARVPGAPAKLDQRPASEVQAELHSIGGVFDLPEVSHRARPIARIHALPDAFSVNITVTPNWTSTLRVLAPAITVRASLQMPPPEG